jgi:phenylalanine-4-hydroxylase
LDLARGVTISKGGSPQREDVMLGTAREQPHDDYTIGQDWESYAADEHARWRTLFRRQAAQLPGRAAPEFLDGLGVLGVAGGGIPDFGHLSEILMRRTGWQVVAVPGLVPDDVFFAHLAARRFPATRFIRPAERLDYVQEPDVFHDVFGHVPLLAHPVFADFMALYGRQGLAAAARGRLAELARLYWYTVEFGLIRTPEGLRIYGSGIVSSQGEVPYSLEDRRPRRIAFTPERVLRTRYRIDAYQEVYFVIDDYRALFAALDRDLGAILDGIARLPVLAPGDPLPEDRLVAVDGVPP